MNARAILIRINEAETAKKCKTPKISTLIEILTRSLFYGILFCSIDGIQPQIQGKYASTEQNIGSFQLMAREDGIESREREH